ncbi:MAG: hypothetical protein ACLQU2_30905 [Candidatus Binataceae bacterium]
MTATVWRIILLTARCSEQPHTARSALYQSFYEYFVLLNLCENTTGVTRKRILRPTLSPLSNILTRLLGLILARRLRSNSSPPASANLLPGLVGKGQPRYHTARTAPPAGNAVAGFWREKSVPCP